MDDSSCRSCMLAARVSSVLRDGDNEALRALLVELRDSIQAAESSTDSGHVFKQPGWDHVYAAFVEGAREAQRNPTAGEADFQRAADGYTKRIFEEVDPESERRLRENDWPRC